MKFMNAYKHLDNLCRDINDLGVTGYIEEMERDMENDHIGVPQVPSWENDYKQLKHYRWIRNRIVHENHVDEDELCEPEDAEWLEEFYHRIIEQTDPLTLARKAFSSHRHSFYKDAESEQRESYRHRDDTPEPNKAGCGAVGGVAIIIFVLFLYRVLL